MPSFNTKTAIVCIIFGLLNIVYTICGSIYLEKYKNFENECYSIWKYCFMGCLFTSIIFIISLIIGVLRWYVRERKILEDIAIISIITLLLLSLIFGSVILGNIPLECKIRYYITPELWTLFLTQFWYSITFFSILLINYIKNILLS